MSAPALAVARSSASVLECFHQFWTEVVRVRDRELVQALPAESLITAADGIPATAYNTAHDYLLRFLRQQQTQTANLGHPLLLERYREAQYVMASLADEVFLGLSGPGAMAWKHQLLETELFGTRNAGDNFYQRIEHLLEAGNPETRELAAIYLSALALGFRGRYLRRDDNGRIASYRKRLGEFVLGRAVASGTSGRPFLPECYESTVDAGPGRKLRDARIWSLAVVAVFVIWLAASHVWWMDIYGDIRSQIQSVTPQQRRGK